MTFEHKQKLRKARLGSHHDTQTRRLMSKARKTNVATWTKDQCTMCGSSAHSTTVHKHNAAAGRRKSKKWRRAVAIGNSARLTGKKTTTKTREKMSRSQTLVQNTPEMKAFHSRHSKEMWAKRTEKEKQVIFEKISAAQVGRMPAALRGRLYEYGRYQMRSTWEVAFAAKLDHWKIEWKYEPRNFFVGKGKWNGRGYVPDFYLPEFDLYVEIKGYLRKDNKRKLQQFRKKYPDTRWMLLQKDDLEMLGIFDTTKVSCRKRVRAAFQSTTLGPE